MGIQTEPEIFNRVDTIVLETHERFTGEAKNRVVLKNLEEMGFRIIDAESMVLVLKRDRSSPAFM